MTQRKVLLKKWKVIGNNLYKKTMPKIPFIICLACLFLFSCAITNQLQPLPKVDFITATIGLPPALPTIAEGIETTLTPLPAQIYAMTQDALTTPYAHPRVEIITQTYTPLIFPTETLTPSLTPLPATQSAQPSPTRTPKPLCRPEYPDFCIPYNNKKNCKDWNNLGYYNFTVLQPDPLHYDKDFNGLGCEG